MTTSADSNTGPSGGRWRVKMYHLADDGQWADKGTGFCSLTYVENYRGFAICCESEDADQYFKQYELVAEDIYQQQGATIITWKEPSNDVDLALSFQEESGCHEIWAQITECQGKVVTDYSGGATTPRSHNSEEDEEAGLILPQPVLAQLEAIANMLAVGEGDTVKLGPQRKSQVAHAIVSKGPEWMLALLNVVSELEDLEDTAHLDVVFRIFTGIALLNDAHVFELLVSDDCADGVFGAFEHDPAARGKLEHRTFISSTASFHEIVPVSDQSVLTKIHETFRLEYLKDMVLAPVGDDVTIATLNTLLHLNNSYIVMRLQGDKTFLLPLLDLLSGDNVPLDKLEGAVAVLHKMCDLAKNLQVEDRDIFYNSLFTSGRSFFQIFERLLGSHNSDRLQPITRVRCLQILSCAVSHRPLNLHAFIVERSSHPKPPSPSIADGSSPLGVSLSVTAAFRQQQQQQVGGKDKGEGKEGSNGTAVDEGPPSLLWILEGMLIAGNDSSIQAEADAILRLLLNPEHMEYRKDKFLTLFYDHYMAWLCLPLFAGTTQKAEMATAAAAAGVCSADHVAVPACMDNACVQAGKNYVCEMLSLFVKLHGFRIKYFTLRNNVVQKVVRLLLCRRKHIRLSAVRFVRACINNKDEFYNRYIIKNDLLSPLFQAFHRNGVNRDDMLNSAVCELVEFIRTEKIKSLAVYIIETCGELFKGVEYVQTFDGLRKYYDMAMEFQRNKNQFANSADTNGEVDEDRMKANNRFKQQLQEDSYFSEDNAAESSAKGNATKAAEGTGTSSPMPMDAADNASENRKVLVEYEDHDSDDSSGDNEISLQSNQDRDKRHRTNGGGNAVASPAPTGEGVQKASDANAGDAGAEPNHKRAKLAPF